MKIIIVGAGEVGYHLAGRLALENKDVVLIDTRGEAIRRVADSIDVQTIQGSGSSPVILEQAGIKEADILLAVTDSDETNLVSCLVADILSPSTQKLVRLRSVDFEAYHQIFKERQPHIERVINPEIEMIGTIENMLSAPGAADIAEFAQGRVLVVGVRLERQSPFIGIRLAELPAHTQTAPPLIAAIVRQEQLIVPTGADRLAANDVVYFICKADDTATHLALFGKDSRPAKRVLIVGGGRAGYRLAQQLEAKSIHVKIVDRDRARCDSLAEILNKTIVLCGDGTDRALLEEENVQEVDGVVALTNDEETNILVSLLAKQMGARRAITKISKFNYLPLMDSIGIEQVVSPRLSAINTILHHIRRGRIFAAISLKGEQAEVLEAEALETAQVVGKPLKDFKFPKGALLGCIIRGEDVMIPSGESVVHPGDRIIIIARREAVAQVEKLLTVKLEYF